uniref:Translocation protein TolB n=1 Tax=Solibacter usitatus (strain Ellin6076) TaxID=234267 RepID=Q01NT1_SOLUE
MIYALLLLLSAFPLSAQVIFSRRIYQETGRTHQQLWNWNPADNTLRQLSDSPRDHLDPSCSGSGIHFVSPSESPLKDNLWNFDRAGSKETLLGPLPPDANDKTRTLPGCDVSAVRGPLYACARRGELSITRGGVELGRLAPGTSDLPIEALSWSPTGKWLLVGTLGVNTNSTSPQSDLFVVEVPAMKLVKAASGNAAAWLPSRDRFFYTTPREMANLPGARRPRGVWVEQLMLFDPQTGKSAAITSGLTNNVQPVVCGK